jgi:hypothetical protein
MLFSSENWPWREQRCKPKCCPGQRHISSWYLVNALAEELAAGVFPANSRIMPQSEA